MKKIVFAFCTMVLLFVANSIDAQTHHDLFVKRITKNKTKVYVDRRRNVHCETPPPPPRRTCGNEGYYDYDGYVIHRSQCANRHVRVRSCKCRTEYIRDDRYPQRTRRSRYRNYDRHGDRYYSDANYRRPVSKPCTVPARRYKRY